jgi:coenzyme F420 hydrogenase subunit beta
MTLKTVIDRNLCSGCGICASILGPERARMELVEPGYLRPVLNAPPSAVEEAMLASVCPGSRVTVPDRAEIETVDFGPVLAVRTGHARDAVLRHRSSSGGAISAMLQHLLAQPDGPSYILHVGTDDQVPWLNRVGESRDADGVAERAGSRYAPSAPLADIRAHLDRGERFAVVGKPCDIAALRAYSRFDDRVDRQVVVMIAFMCGGIPSETGIRSLLERMQAPVAEVTHFRYRGNGWPGQATATLASGEERSISYAQSWGDVLSKHMQFRCKICADGTGMTADVVCADAWFGDERGYPLFDEQEGRSLILIRTARGAALVEAAVASGRLETAGASMADVLAMQPYQARRTRLTLARLLALRLVGRPVPRYPGIRLWRAALRAGWRANLRGFLGALARALRGRL